MGETLVAGSTLSFTIGTSAAGMSRHRRLGNVRGKVVVALAVGALPCVLLGELAHIGLRNLCGAQFGIVFRAIYLAMLLLTAWVMRRGQAWHVGGKSLVQRAPFGPYIDLGEGHERASLPATCAIGGSIGFVLGLLGIGGGVLFVPLLFVAIGLTAHESVGTSLGVVLISSIFGSLLYARGGFVNLLVVMLLLAGSAFGVQVGAWICERLHGEKLQQYFVYVVVFAALLVAGDMAWRLLA